MTTPQRIIFVVDDDPDDLEFFREAILKIDDSFKCIQCADGKMAGQLIQLNIIPAIVFIDINMPVYNGFELLKDLRSKYNVENLQIAMLSTSMNAEYSAKLTSMGAQYTLQKPSSFNGYLEMLTPILANI
ncbi:response regulator [Chryseolinea sp. T2]|uniref:response regulator n=1 Tax=Chryseolinea sp. T2 TaxID=3129255 RepID=UPI0030781F24